MERRGKQRLVAKATVQCRVPAVPTDAKLLDISSTGCRAEAGRPDMPSRGTTVLIDLPVVGTAAGEVVWRSGKDFGVHFSQPLADDDVARVADVVSDRDLTLQDSFGRRLPDMSSPRRRRRT